MACGGGPRSGRAPRRVGGWLRFAEPAMFAQGVGAMLSGVGGVLIGLLNGLLFAFVAGVVVLLLPLLPVLVGRSQGCSGSTALNPCSILRVGLGAHWRVGDDQSRALLISIGVL